MPNRPSKKPRTRAQRKERLPETASAHRQLAAARRRQRRLKSEFDAVHEDARKRLASGDFTAMGESIDRERIIIEEQTRLIDEHLAFTKERQRKRDGG